MTRLVGNPYTVWGACFVGGVYGECARACRTMRELRCAAAPTFFGACLEAELSEEECKKRCKEDPHPGCPEVEEEGDSGRAPLLGYDRKDGKLVANDDEKKTVLQMYQWCASGRSLAEIARDLNAAGKRRKFGDRFDESSVAAILRRNVYLGIPDRAEQVVPKDLWDRAQERLK